MALFFNFIINGFLESIWLNPLQYGFIMFREEDHNLLWFEIFFQVIVLIYTKLLQDVVLYVLLWSRSYMTWKLEYFSFLEHFYWYGDYEMVLKIKLEEWVR